MSGFLIVEKPWAELPLRYEPVDFAGQGITATALKLAVISIAASELLLGIVVQISRPIAAPTMAAWPLSVDAMPSFSSTI